MLSHLSVRHFAILDNIDVDFKAGMTALTGETGAGKSLLIDAIGLLLGDRANAEVVRTGEDYCEITGLFSNLDEPALVALKALDIEAPDRECIITRQIATNSANTIKINRRPVTLQDLRTLTLHLADIHTQHDTKRLINPDTYLSLIDYYDKSIPIDLKEYQHKRRDYLQALSALNALQQSKDEMLEKLDYQRFQLEEIEKHQLSIDEEQLIEDELEKLQNFDKIFQSLKRALEAMQDKDALEHIYDAGSSLELIADFDNSYKTISERIKSAYYELDDIKDTLSQELFGMDFNPERLDGLESRKHSLEMLKRKHRKSITEIIDYAEILKVSINEYDHYDDTLKEKQIILKDTFNHVKTAALTLSENRKKQAKLIETRLINVLETLALKNTSFNIAFDSISLNDMGNAKVFKEDGVDIVDFLLSTNVGESLKPLSKVASGGELSRIMLALKDILIKNMGLSMIIFDEIDTGVSGYVAAQVASKIADIAQSTQVITITHLPQVAAKADHHYHIYKASDETRTKAFIKVLDHEGRIHELAAMMSSDTVTEHALKSAESLLGK